MGKLLSRNSASTCAAEPGRDQKAGRDVDGRDAPAGEFSSCSTATDPIWLFPGLGCRHVGMGHDLFGKFAVADRIFTEAEAMLGFDIREACLEGSGRKYVPPRQEAQLIYVLECAYAAVLTELEQKSRIVSGHSLGNWAAACVAGAYDFKTGLELVTAVESLLEECVDGRGQAMGVIVGLDEAVVLSMLAGFPETCVANWNSPGQYVIAGPEADVTTVLAGAEERGAKRAKRLATNRALHTPHLGEVGALLRARLDTVRWASPKTPILSSRDAALLTTGEQVRDFLAGFLVHPVRWDATIRALVQDWGRAFVEVGPGNVLSGMLPFIDRGAVIRTASEILSQNTEL